MNDFIIRKATINDVPFLVDTIVEAEKSGTDKLAYSTIFGLSEEDTRKYIALMLLEEVDGCELSISSFLIAEKNGKIAAATAAWIEGMNGISSTVLKGNLLNYTLPKDSISKALSINHIIREIHIEYIPESIQLGLVYVSSGFRGLGLVSLLIKEQIIHLHNFRPNITGMYVQVFGNNIPAIKSYEKSDFKVILVKEAPNKEILQYLPSDKKILMKKELLTK